MRKSFSAKDSISMIRAKKIFSILGKDFSIVQKIQKRSHIFNKIGNTLDKVSTNQKPKTNRFDILESKLDQLKKDIGEMKNSVNTLLLIYLCKEDFFSFEQKQKMKDIIKKEGKKILNRFNINNSNINNNKNQLLKRSRCNKIKIEKKKFKNTFNNKNKKSSFINKLNQSKK